ncbi:MAG: hypothetical protein OEW39_05555 [Deltaproteobacteria bacterium]|nr:hypothetical protein [Deltaproteobacteria bacterium]
MKDTVTFIISRNYGRSLSLSLPALQVYIGGAAAAVLLLVMFLLSLMYLVTYPRIRSIESEFENLRKERDALRDQVLSANQDAWEAKEAEWQARLEKKDETQPVQVAGSDGEGQYLQPVRVDSLTTRVNGSSVEVAFRLENEGDEVNRGGYLYVIFENNEREPVEYNATPGVATNEDGFPQSYKSGIRFTRFHDAATFRRMIRRASATEYYTHVTLYLFTVRGGLMLKERFELDRDLFMQDRPVVRTQQPARI